MSTPNTIRTALGVLSVAALCSVVTANIEHTVMQIDRTFVPATITVAPGDTVRWVHTGGGHTVTSGADCTFDGLYFDEPLTVQNPLVEWVVPGDLEGAVPYFCDPHCGNDMVGGINVVAGPCVETGDVTGEGCVDFDDLLLVLSAWNSAGAPGIDGDGSCDGTVSFDDLLLVLSTWGDGCP